MGLLGGATVVFAALRLASPVAAAALHFPTWPKPPTDSHVDAKNLTVDIAYGVYQGVHNSSTKLNVWKGIRYAAPPVGNLRWKDAVVPATNRTVTLADSFGPMCPQVLPPGASYFTNGVEDCLFLNIWAPEDADNVPVLVWVHGGGYGFGDGTQDMTEIINDNGNKFVVVSIQYRLGAFGFLASEEINENGLLNAGLNDQAFAFSWVQEYISAFGGDPSRVTISGESAGGGSVMYHAMAQQATLGTTLFKNVIASSPYLMPQYNFYDSVPTGRYYDFAKAAGCGSTGSVLECLRSKDTPTLQRANYDVGQLAVSGMWYYLPVTDGTYVVGLPSQALNSGRSNGLRVLVGNNANEGDLFVPTNLTKESDLASWLTAEFPALDPYLMPSILEQYPLSREGTTMQRARNIYAESAFVCPSYWLATAFSGQGKKAWHYQYSVPFAQHGADMSAVFGPKGVNQSPDLVQSFRTMWGRFIVDDDPGASYPAWTDGTTARQVNFNVTGGTAFDITTGWGSTETEYKGPGLTSDIQVVDAYAWDGGRGARCAFWKQLGPKIPQ